MYTVTNEKDVLALERVIEDKLIANLKAYDFAKGIVALGKLANGEGGNFKSVTLYISQSDEEDCEIVNFVHLTDSNGDIVDTFDENEHHDSVLMVDHEVLSNFYYGSENLKFAYARGVGKAGEDDAYVFDFDTAKEYVERTEKEIKRISKLLEDV